MKLSMWILYDWLAQYDPEPRIEEGARTIQNVRLYSGLGKVSRNTIYLNEIEPGKIMCANGRDILIVRCNDIEEILNSVLDAFDYYNEWIEQLRAMIYRGCTLDELLEFGYTVIRRMMLIGDSSYYLRNIYAPDRVLFENQTLQETLSNRIMPLPVLMKINQDKKFRASGARTYLSTVPEMGVTCAMNNLFVQKKQVGWLLTQSGSNRYTQGELDIQDAFVEMVVLWLTENEEGEALASHTTALLDILAGAADVASIYSRFRVLDWNRSDNLMLYTIAHLTPEADAFRITERFLSGISEHCLVVHYEQRILYLVNTSLTDRAVCEKQMLEILRQCRCFAVRSVVFHDVMDIRRNFEIADLALRFCGHREPGMIDIQNSMLTYMLSLIWKNTATNPTHPAIGLLKDYDVEHSTDFSGTLFTFLKNGCSYVATAKELYIHRSTLLYRIQKIQSVTQIDLEDFTTRVYLELSFLLEKQGKTGYEPDSCRPGEDR